MPDLEQRIREGLDRLGERPDPARILKQVNRRRRHLRVVRRLQAATLVVALLAGVALGTYALARTFGLGSAPAIPGGSLTPQSSPTAKPRPSPSPSHRPPSPSPSAQPSGSVTLCSDLTAAVEVASQQGAVGTISTVWRVTNTAQTPCRSFGYPGMDFHTLRGWLNVQVHRGGFPNINQPPAPIVVPPGQRLYFVSYWNDATTQTGPCESFDRVKVTLPDNTISAVVTASGCLAPNSVDVGPVTRSSSA